MIKRVWYAIRHKTAPIDYKLIDQGYRVTRYVALNNGIYQPLYATPDHSETMRIIRNAKRGCYHAH